MGADNAEGQAPHHDQLGFLAGRRLAAEHHFAQDRALDEPFDVARKDVFVDAGQGSRVMRIGPHANRARSCLLPLASSANARIGSDSGVHLRCELLEVTQGLPGEGEDDVPIDALVVVHGDVAEAHRPAKARCQLKF